MAEFASVKLELLTSSVISGGCLQAIFPLGQETYLEGDAVWVLSSADENELLTYTETNISSADENVIPDRDKRMPKII